ncbi:TRAP transporter substrate-binding protein [Paenalcaligenes sp. Me131]|uniref:TRAP transporter substrate-binding protein n=1 Tax=Paenalcaligenes sp. Me131 TaxID=3392636 RepID=UPI003D2ADA6A
MYNVTKKIGAAVVMTACLFTVSNTVSAKNFRLGLLTPANHIWTEAATQFGKDLEEASGGQHRVAVFPAAQLGNEAQMLQQLQTGALDMAFLTIAEVSNRYADMGALYAPYLVSSMEQVGSVLNSPPAQSLLDALPAKAGVVGMAYGTGGLRQIVSAKPVETLGDLKGKKLRITPLEPLQDFYRGLGTAPTALPLSVVYDALSNGQVDAIDMDLEMIIGLKFYDKAETVVLSNHIMFPVVGVVSARVWAGLDDSTKQMIKSLMQEQLGKTITLYAQKEQEWKEQLLATGVTVNEVGPEFFGATLEQWDSQWQEKTPVLKQLRDISASFSTSQ